MNRLNTLPKNDRSPISEAVPAPSEELIQSDLVRYALIQASIVDDGQLVDAGPVRAHLRMLLDSGMQTKQIARLSGVSRSAINRVLYGSPSHNVLPQANISEASYHRILCVTTDMISDNEIMIDSTGSIRRLQALAVMGFSVKIVAEESGISYNVLLDVDKRPRVKSTVALSLKEAYDRICTQSPQMTTQAEKASVSKVKVQASKNKWLSPKAWEDSDIDDPQQEGRMRCECKTVEHQHGTRDAYLTDKCRCTPCKEAHRAITNHNRRLAAYGRSTNHMVDAKPVRKHVKDLMQRGWGIDLIVSNTGAGRNTISRLLYGEPAKNLPFPSVIKSDLSDRILAYAPTGHRTRHEGTALESVDATGTKRRIQALIACGYSMTFIAAEFGTHKQVISGMLKNERVLLTKAEEFKIIYDKLWNVEPPRNTPSEKKAYTTAKKMASENGWFPPMAWDDDYIDNPKCKAVA
jgi:hypothetical protein